MHPYPWPTPQDDREAKVFSRWRSSGIRPSTAGIYSLWGRRFRQYCRLRGLNEVEQLTLAGARAFILAYRWPGPSRQRINSEIGASVRVALHAWACALRSLDESVPQWTPPPISPRVPKLISVYSEFRKMHRGVAPNTLVRDISVVSQFLQHLRSTHRSVGTVRIVDIDTFVSKMGKRNCRRIVATNCSCLRCFLRFLLATGRIRKDLASFVYAPRYRTDESPPHILPWQDVRKILRVIPRDTAIGRRDFAMFLLLATYGLGGAELTKMRLEDISWEKRVLQVRRPKTGVPIELPLLPAVGRAIAAYLKRGRPRHVIIREIFVSMHMPHRKITGSVLQNRVRVYALRAGLRHEGLGSHLFRRCHATRQIDSGVSQKMVADILGHRRPASTSVYIRVAFNRLRTVALPVPR